VGCRLDSEAGYLAVKLFKGSIGTNNTDSNSRLCMASAVAGYRTSFGADGPPCCYADIDLSDCLVVWGSNMAEAFPVTFDRVKAHLKANPGVELIVVDPRRTKTANYATLHVPVAPGGDIPLMNAVGRLLLPAAQFAEKTGIMTSSKRLVSFSEQVVKPPGRTSPRARPPTTSSRWS
jgi:ferredoxin-nitrate reductase